VPPPLGLFRTGAPRRSLPWARSGRRLRCGGAPQVRGCSFPGVPHRCPLWGLFDLGILPVGVTWARSERRLRCRGTPAWRAPALPWVCHPGGVLFRRPSWPAMKEEGDEQPPCCPFVLPPRRAPVELVDLFLLFLQPKTMAAFPWGYEGDFSLPRSSTSWEREGGRLAIWL
jgi:hypothetical protein